MSNKKPLDIMDLLRTHFKEREWAWDDSIAPEVLAFVYQGPPQWRCFARGRQAQQQVLFYSLAPFRCPPERRAAATEFIMRVNYDLPMGNFEMDLDDGEIRFKTSIDIENVRPSHAIFDNLVASNVFLFNGYLPALIAVVQDGADPREAIAAVEG